MDKLQALTDRLTSLISLSGRSLNSIEAAAGLSHYRLRRLISGKAIITVDDLLSLEPVLGPIFSVAIPRGPHSPKAKQRTLDASAKRLSGKITNAESLPSEALSDFDRLLDSD